MRLRLAVAGLGIAGALAFTMVGPSGLALADANSPNVSCDSGHGAFGAFSQNPNSPVGYPDNQKAGDIAAAGAPNFGQSHNFLQGSNNKDYAEFCNG